MERKLTGNEVNKEFDEESTKIFPNKAELEQKAFQPDLRDINSLSEQQSEELRRRIGKSQGRAIVFIHPYYPEDDSVWTDFGPSFPEDLKKMRESLPKLIAAQNRNSPPIIIFNDSDKTSDLKAELSQTQSSTDSYIVPTLSHDPIPAKGSWDDLLKKFKELGVSEVIMAGMNLVISWPDDDDPRVAGCVADAAKELSREFKITISKFVYPNTKEDYARFRGPKGPEDYLKELL